MSFPVYKMQGAGNDFVFAQLADLPENTDLKALAQDICSRPFGIGADGLALFTEPEGQEITWHFYNNDGSLAEMCGNAARCAFLYLQDKFHWTEGVLHTAIGPVQGEVKNQRVLVSWELQTLNLEEMEVTIEGGNTYQGHFIDTGVPHFVLHDLNPEPSRQTCLMIQSHEAFAPRQTNVTVLSGTSSDRPRTKSFERGVRDFTWACGTGVIASALVLEKLNGGTKQSLMAPGGPMEVERKEKRLSLLGPAQIVFKADFNNQGTKNV